MIIILPLIPDPADVVIQGEQTVRDYVPSASLLSPVLQGQVIGDKVLGDAVPRAMIGQSDWYGILPRTIGPMRVGGGEIVMQNIGVSPVTMAVDPTQAWLHSKVTLDATGAWFDLSGDLLGALEPDYYTNRELIGDTDNSLLGLPTVFIPREEILRSGLVKRVTSPILPTSFGAHQVLNAYTETTRRWFITGITRDSTGAPLGTCRVIAMRSDKIGVNTDQLANPVFADVTSDGSGNYSIQTNTNVPCQLVAYRADVPNVAGVTVNTVVPTDG